MNRRTLLLMILTAPLGVVTPPTLAQNVTGYGSIPDPILLLLREPVVHEDLELTAGQRKQLRQLNEELDGPLLSLRNWPAKKAQDKISQLIEQSRSRADGFLDPAQRERLRQIMLRVRGIQMVVAPEMADRLRLSPSQKDTIEQILDQSAKELQGLRQQLQNGEPRDRIEKLALETRQQEQLRVLEQLTDTQKRQLSDAVGRSFDTSRLGHASFKAPALTETGEWINSEPQRLDDLRGRVVAVHFWAFG